MRAIKAFLYLAAIIALFLAAAFAFLPDHTNIATSRVFNFLNQGKVPSCSIPVQMQSGSPFIPGSVFSFDGCPAYIRPTEVSINSHGLRGRDYGAKDNKTIRIIALGDSFTFGWGLSEEETMPSRLQDMLDARCDLDIEVLNFGVPGYSIQEEYEILKAKGIAAQPDIVIITSIGDDWSTDRLREVHDSYLSNLTEERCDGSCKADLSLKNFADSQAYMRNERFNETYGEFARYLSLINYLSKENGFDVVVGQYPLEDRWTSRLNERYASYGWKVIDLSRFMRPRYYLNVDDPHPNRKAAYEIASRYADGIGISCS